MSHSELYGMRKAAHQCVACGEQDERTLSGMAYCTVCAAKKAAGLKKARKADTEADRSKRSEYRAKMRAERQAAGLCTACGKYPAATGYKLCRKCRDATRISNSRHRMKSAAGEAKACPFMDGLEDLGEYACLHCPRPTCIYDREEEQ